MKVLRNQLVLPLNFEILIDKNDPEIYCGKIALFRLKALSAF